MNPFKIMALGVVLLAAPQYTGCGEDHTTPPPAKSGPVGLNFTRNPANQPVVSSGTKGWPIFPTDPAVIKDSEGYHLFYTSYFCKAGSAYYYSWDSHNLAACNITDVVAAVGYAYSSDEGLNWDFRGSPVLLPGIADWNMGDIETPFPFVLGDTLYLLYSATGVYQGQPFPDRFQVGASILPLNGGTIRQRLLVDEALFQIQPDPLLPYNVTATSFDNNTQEPSVAIRDGKIELFYVGVGFSLPDQSADAPGQSVESVGVAKAVYGSDFVLIEKSNGYLIPDANITEVHYFDNAYHVFSTTLETGEFHQHEQINYYRSEDGAHWSASRILLSPDTDYDGWGMMAPTVVVESKQVVMFYTGWSILDQPCFPDPFPPNVRFGRPTDNDTKCIYGSIGRAVSVRPAGY